MNGERVKLEAGKACCQELQGSRQRIVAAWTPDGGSDKMKRALSISNEGRGTGFGGRGRVDLRMTIRGESLETGQSRMLV